VATAAQAVGHGGGGCRPEGRKDWRVDGLVKEEKEKDAKLHAFSWWLAPCDWHCAACHCSTATSESQDNKKDSIDTRIVLYIILYMLSARHTHASCK
jgi:hypothetical protein